MRRIHIIGGKNSGKTTLIVELIKYMTGQGMRVGSIKHTHHHHELDTPGKDSFQHREAGAAAVGIVSPGLDAVFLPKDDSQSADPYPSLAPLFADCALVLVEGHSATQAPKIEVWRAATQSVPLAANDASIAAVVSDDAPDVSVPVWSRSDTARLSQRVLELIS